MLLYRELKESLAKERHATKSVSCPTIPLFSYFSPCCQLRADKLVLSFLPVVEDAPSLDR